MKTRNLLFAVLFLVNATLWAQVTPPAVATEHISAMPATASVSQTGAANYHIPIEVPPGTNGVQPNISIVYNSQGGFGTMGIGWDISGLSAITRGTKSFYFDNSVSKNAVQFTDEDELYLDGQRLILLNGQHLQVNAVYCFEVENYSRVTIKEHNSKIYFELKTLDGQIFEYGKDNAEYRSANVGVWSNSTNSVLAWKISKATDVFDNSIDYEYSARGKNLIKITYAGGENEILFSYISNDKNQQRRYINRFYAVNDMLLSEIITKNDNTNVKKYGFAYANADTYKHLTAISEYVYNTNAFDLLNTTNIGWGQQSSIQHLSSIGTSAYDWLHNENNSSLYSGDIDGDGYQDKIEFSDNADDNTKRFFRVYLKNSTLEPVFFNKNLSVDFNASLIVGDINGDGKDEIILIHSDYYFDGNVHRLTLELVIKVYSFDNATNSLTLIDTKRIPEPDRYDERKQHYQAFLINQNGDQYPDLVIVPYWQKLNLGDHNSGLIRDAGDIITLAGQANGTLGAPVFSALDLASNSERGAWHTPLIGDFDADGVPDILHILCNDPHENPRFNSYDGFNVQTSKNWGSSLFYISTGIFDIKQFEALYPIDANNDGRTDVLVHRNERYSNPYNEYRWHILQSNGLDVESTIMPTLPLPACKQSSSAQNRFYPIIMDYNGDGMQDIVLAYEWHNNNNSGYVYGPTYFIFYKNDNGTFVEDVTLGGSSGRLSKMQPVVMDINNDGILDLVYLNENGDYSAFTMPNANKHHLVYSITNGMGQTDRFSYKNNNSYELPANSDVRTLNSPIAVVEFHFQSNGKIVDYVFQKAKVHKTKGFLGFEKTIANNITKTVKTENSYEYSAEYYNMYLRKQEIRTSAICQNAQSNLVATTIFTNENIVIDNRRYIPTTTQIEVTDHLTGAVKTVINEYEKYNPVQRGNLLSETVSEGDYTTKTEYYDFVAQGSIAEYLPQFKKITFSKKGGEDIEYVTKFEYAGLKPQIGRRTDFFNKPEQIITVYEYYSTGNLAIETITVPNLIPQVTTYQYDNLFRLPIRIYNTALDFSEIGYDFANGNIQSETGIDGLLTKYHYNFAGYLDTKELPNGQLIKYNRVSTDDYNAKYKITETIVMEVPLVKTTYYDIYGRQVYKTQTGADGELLHSRNEYNFKNQLSKAILPHELSETDDSRAFVVYEYDCFGRVAKEIKFDRVNELVTEYIYNGLVTTIINPNQTQQTVEKDAKGLVTMRSEDFTRYICYDYDAEGKPILITAADGSKTEIEYDEYGHQEKLIDPNAGTLEYLYHLNGLLKWQKNANLAETDIIYDNLWRKAEKNINCINNQNYVYVYDYVQSGYGIGQIAMIEYYEDSRLKHSQSFDYNQNHLLERKIDIYEGEVYPFYYDYDDLWRLVLRKSPSGLEIRTHYNAYGQIYRINTNETEVIWELDNQNAKGQILDFTLGNGIKSEYRYYNNGLLSSIYSIKNNNSLQNLKYDYDSRYNLISRHDNRRGFDEFFEYDDLNRLTDCHFSGHPTLTIKYEDSNGNINNKSDVGDYKYYSNNKPHAVREIDESGQTTGDGVMEQERQYLKYTPFNKVMSVHQSYTNETYNIYYGANQQRIKTIYFDYNGEQFTRLYFGSFERELNPDGSETLVDYIFAPTGLCAIRKDGCNEGLFYVLNDNMGSVQIVTKEDDILNEWYYTPWGGRVRVDDRVGYDPDITDRGYTGHERLTALGLINMNGRIYDPTLARFLSPDPYVQAPDFSQSFNRYSYCLNNPFKYIDPTGEKWKWWGWMLLGMGLIDPATAIATATTVGATIAGGAATVAATTYTSTAVVSLFLLSNNDGNSGASGDMLKNMWRITNGLFVTNPNRNFFGRVWEFTSRFSWEIIQTNVGYFYTQGRNLGGNVSRVDYFDGATFATNENYDGYRGISLGSYINISMDEKITGSFQDWVLSDPLLMHEFGHTFDSRAFGISYLFAIGIPSIVSADRNELITKWNGVEVDNPNRLYTHDVYWTETRANRRAAKYFQKYYGIDWETLYLRYPLNNPFK